MAALEALYDAADDDSATGGPDLARRIFPVVAVVDADGVPATARRRARRRWCDLVVDAPRMQRPDGPASRPADRLTTGRATRHERAVLRLARADHQGQGGLRAQGHRAAAAASSCCSTTAASCSSPRTRRGPCTRSPRSTTGSRFAAVGKYNEFENLRVAGVRLADLRGYSYDRARRDRPQPGQRLRADARHDLHRDAQAVRGGDRRRRGRRAPDDDQLYRLTFDGSVADEHGFVAMGGSAEQIRPP